MSKQVKQGCILSPMWFLLLVQEITNEIRNSEGYGIQLTPDILLFADDIVLIADTVFESQNLMYYMKSLQSLVL